MEEAAKSLDFIVAAQLRDEIAALKEGVAINPGEEWTVDGTKNRCRMRLCFGNPDETLIREGIARLAVVCHQEFGVPSQISNIEQF